MRNLFALIGVLIVAAVGVGWYLGWYKVNVSKNSDGNLQIQTDVDTKKVTTDSAAFFQKVGQMVNEKVQQTSQTGNPLPANTPANTPGGPEGVPQVNSPGLPGFPTITTGTVPKYPVPPPVIPNGSGQGQQ